MSALGQLHAEVARCTLCADVLDPTKAPRRTEAGPSRSPLFIVSQALARDTQRVSGIPYINQAGALSNTGARLESFLNMIGFTLRPAEAVAIGTGRLVGAAPVGLQQAYNSEIVQCFPGKVADGRGDALPSLAARRCLEQRFLEREIALVDPSVILLLGTRTAGWFEKTLSGSVRFSGTLSTSLETLCATDTPPAVSLGGKRRHVVRIIHPSGLTTRRFRQLVLDNEALVTMLRRLLDLPQL